MLVVQAMLQRETRNMVGFFFGVVCFEFAFKKTTG